MSTVELTATDEQIQPYILRITELDRMIHVPSRLALLTALEAYRPGALHFGALQRLTGLSRGNISGHLSRLEWAGLVAVERRVVGKRPRAWALVTELGAERVSGHLREMCEIRDALEAIEAEEAK